MTTPLRCNPSRRTLAPDFVYLGYALLLIVLGIKWGLHGLLASLFALPATLFFCAHLRTSFLLALFDARTIGLVFYAGFFSTGVLSYATQFPHEMPVKAYVLSFAGLLGLSAGIMFPRQSRFRYEKQILTTRLRTIFMLASVPGLLATYYTVHLHGGYITYLLMPYGTAPVVNPLWQTIAVNFSLTLISCLTLGLVLLKTPCGTSTRLMVGCTVVYALFYFACLKARGNFSGFALVYIGVSAVMATRRTSVLKVALLGVTTLVVVVALSLVRGNPQGALAEDRVDTVTPLLGSADLFGTVVSITSLIPADLSYQKGQSVVAFLVNPIPRYYWPDKPIGFGATLVRFMYGDENTNYSMAPSLPGEIYANGGMLPVIPVMAMYGWGLVWLNGVLQSATRSNTSLCLYFLLLPSYLGFIRGDFLSAAVPFFFVSVPLAIWVWIASNRRDSRVDHREAK